MSAPRGAGNSLDPYYDGTASGLEQFIEQQEIMLSQIERQQSKTDGSNSGRSSENHPPQFARYASDSFSVSSGTRGAHRSSFEDQRQERGASSDLNNYYSHPHRSNGTTTQRRKEGPPPRYPQDQFSEYPLETPSVYPSAASLAEYPERTSKQRPRQLPRFHDSPLPPSQENPRSDFEDAQFRAYKNDGLRHFPEESQLLRHSSNPVRRRQIDDSLSGGLYTNFHRQHKSPPPTEPRFETYSDDRSHMKELPYERSQAQYQARLKEFPRGNSEYDSFSAKDAYYEDEQGSLYPTNQVSSYLEDQHLKEQAPLYPKEPLHEELSRPFSSFSKEELAAERAPISPPEPYVDETSFAADGGGFVEDMIKEQYEIMARIQEQKQKEEEERSALLAAQEEEQRQFDLYQEYGGISDAPRSQDGTGLDLPIGEGFVDPSIDEFEDKNKEVERTEDSEGYVRRIQLYEGQHLKILHRKEEAEEEEEQVSVRCAGCGVILMVRKTCELLYCPQCHTLTPTELGKKRRKKKPKS